MNLMSDGAAAWRRRAPAPAGFPIVVLGDISSATRFSLSNDAISYGSPITPTGLSNPLSDIVAGSGGRIVTSHGSTARYSDDDGASWTTVTHGLPDVFVGKMVNSSGAIMCSLQSSNGLGRSTDNGVTWSNVGASKGSVRVGFSGSFVVSLSATSQPMHSTDNGATWSALGSRLDTTPAAFNPNSARGAAFGSRVAFGGQIWGGPFGIGGFIPAIAYTVNGDDWFFSRVADTAGENVVVLSHNGAVGIAIIGNGDTYLTTDFGDTWTASTSGLGTTSTCAIWNGSLFVVGGGSTIKTSPDGDSFTTRTHPLNDVFDIAVKA